jgi:uncharacterized protein (DUF488 family)
MLNISGREQHRAMRIHTIGHSNRRWADFLALLQRHGVTVLIDVRSHPRSRFPHFNAGRLAPALETAGIRYLPMGDALGGKPADPALYGAGRTPGKDFPDFDLVRKTALYRTGIDELADRVREQSGGQVCIVCAEGDPAHCHRTLLIRPDLEALGIEVVDIVR